MLKIYGKECERNDLFVLEKFGKFIKFQMYNKLGNFKAMNLRNMVI